MNKSEKLKTLLQAKKAILFDLDGTLVDSNDFHAEAWSKVLTKNGHSFSQATIRPWIGKGGDKILKELVGIDDKSKEGEQILSMRSTLFKEIYAPRIQAFAKAADLLHCLRVSGYTVALASSAKLDELNAVLKVAGLVGTVDQITSSDDAEHSKPDPDILTSALAKCKVSAAYAIMVGDTPYDIEASKGAGVKTIAVRSGGWSDESLKDADLIFDNVHEILISL